MELQFGIGTQFIQRHGKRRDVETVVDVLIQTSLSTGKVTEIVYLTAHDFCGQRLTRHVPAATIARSEIVNLFPGAEIKQTY